MRGWVGLEITEDTRENRDNNRVTPVWKAKLPAAPCSLTTPATQAEAASVKIPNFPPMNDHKVILAHLIPACLLFLCAATGTYICPDYIS